MASRWGEQLTISLFGESHGPAVGVVLDGVPPGEELDLEAMEAFIKRRAPGHTPWSTTRKERDTFSILSGFYQGKTTGTPLTIVIENKDARSLDYAKTSYLPRPSHADYTGTVRFKGASDPRGGGHFSGRLTASLCVAGAICKQILERRGIEIYARIAELGGISDLGLDPANPDLSSLKSLADKKLSVVDDEKGKEMVDLIEKVRTQGDSLGGIVQCFALGLPAGLGDPMFGGVESRLASLFYGIPAVKGVSFGDGFDVSRRRGSENNDPFYVDRQGQVRTLTNHEGGINGGITNGMPLVVQVGIKPTPSIGLPQKTVNLQTLSDEFLTIQGRHDPSIVPRAVVVVEAAAAIAILDLVLVAFGLQGLGGMKHGT